MCCPLLHATHIAPHKYVIFALCAPNGICSDQWWIFKKNCIASSVFCQIFWDTWALQIFQRSAVQDLQNSGTSVQLFFILGACNVVLSRLNDVSRKMPPLVPALPSKHLGAPLGITRHFIYIFPDWGRLEHIGVWQWGVSPACESELPPSLLSPFSLFSSSLSFLNHWHRPPLIAPAPWPSAPRHPRRAAPLQVPPHRCATKTNVEPISPTFS